MTKKYIALAEKLGVGHKDLISMANSPSYFYRSFRIPKRRNGYRQIDAPVSKLLTVQRRIKDLYFRDEFLNPAATAYRRGTSIVDNAAAHHGSEYLLKLDLENFFGNIEFGRVLKLLESIVEEREQALILTQLVTYRKVLPQGGATSPTISNLIARNLDGRLAGLAKTLGFKYTRYSDDLTFSGEKRFTQANLCIIEQIVKEEGLLVNTKKTHFVNTYKKVVTGINIHGDRLNVPRAYRREVKANVFKLHRDLRRNGLDAIEDPIVLERLEGRLNFWRFVSPEDQQLARIEEVFEQTRTEFEKLLG